MRRKRIISRSASKKRRYEYKESRGFYEMAALL